MPGRNGTGPQGKGPVTGGGRGSCRQKRKTVADQCGGSGQGRGRSGAGQGRGKGMGRGLGQQAVDTPPVADDYIER